MLKVCAARSQRHVEALALAREVLAQLLGGGRRRTGVARRRVAAIAFEQRDAARLVESVVEEDDAMEALDRAADEERPERRIDDFIVADGDPPCMGETGRS